MKKGLPSQTAIKVALSLISLSQDKDWLGKLPDGMIEATKQLLIASDVSSEQMVNMSAQLWMTNLHLAFDWVIPGQFESFGYRKLFIKEQVCQALDLGARQLLMMGGGYDTLCWQLADKYPETNFIEIDHPTTSTYKQKGVQKMGNKPNLTLLAFDLSTGSLDELLHNIPQWSLGKTSVIVAEGLLQYLPPGDVHATFEKTARCVGPASRFIFTHARMNPQGKPNMGPYTWFNQTMLELLGEPWLWAVNKQGLNDFLGGTGWTLEQDSGDIPIIGLEDYAVAVRGTP